MDELVELRRKLEQRGVTVERTNGGHYRATAADGKTVTLASTPGKGRAVGNAYALVRRELGIDIRKPYRKRGSADDFALQRLRERAVRAMERGATAADLARLAVAESKDKRIGGWENTNSAEVGIHSLLRGGRLMRKNHDALGAALRKLESSTSVIFERHLDSAAERFGVRRTTKPVGVQVEATGSDAERLVADLLRGRNGGRRAPEPDGEVVYIELGPETRAWLADLLTDIQS